MKTPIGLNIETNERLLAQDLNDDLRGLKCKCVCPGCGAKLQARWGPKTKKHFAHYQQVAKDNCGETSLHLLGKHVLSTLSTIQLKTVNLTPEPAQDMLGEQHHSRQVILFEHAIIIEKSEEEVSVDNVKCDVLSEVSYDKTPFIMNFEIKVTHEVDEIKYEKLVKIELNTIEIDLSHLLKLPMITVEDVVYALNDSSNQNIIHLAPALIESQIVNAKATVVSKTNTRNEFIKQWMTGLNKKLSNSGYTLPISHFKTFQSLHPSNPPPPSLDKFLRVKSFIHDNKNRFLLRVANKHQVKELPVYITTPRVSPLPFDDSDYLTMEAVLITPDNPRLITNWGRSSLIKNYNELCRLNLERSKSKAVEKDHQKVNYLLTQVNRLIASGEQLVCDNADVIESLAINNHNEFVNNGVQAEKLKLLYATSIDPYSIFGCPVFHWQTILIFTMFNDRNAEFNVQWASSMLKRHRIDVVGPFKKLSYMSPFIKGQHIELPFDGSYKMLSKYLKHLSSIGFIKPTNSHGRYNLNINGPHNVINTKIPQYSY